MCPKGRMKEKKWSFKGDTFTKVYGITVISGIYVYKSLQDLLAATVILPTNQSTIIMNKKVFKVLATLFVCVSMSYAAEMSEDDAYDEVVWTLSNDNRKVDASIPQRSVNILPTAYYNNESLYFTTPVSMTITYSIMEDENVKGGGNLFLPKKEITSVSLAGLPTGTYEVHIYMGDDEYVGEIVID